MNQRYLKVADEIYQDMSQLVDRFRAELAQEGVAIHKIPPSSMQVELVAQVLIQALAEERIAMTPHKDAEAALKQALQAVRDCVVLYRREGREAPPDPPNPLTQH